LRAEELFAGVRAAGRLFVFLAEPDEPPFERPCCDCRFPFDPPLSSLPDVSLSSVVRFRTSLMISAATVAVPTRVPTPSTIPGR